MTVEQIVERIQNGENLYFELWLTLEKWIRLKAAQRAVESNRESDIDDMIQESWLILPDAVAYYDSSFGVPFLTILTRYYLPRAFNSALYGGRLQSDLKNPMNHADSLDASLPGSDDITLGETLIDENAELPYQFIDDSSFWASVARYIDRGIEQLPEIQGKLIGTMYHEDISQSEAWRRQVIGKKARSYYGRVYRDALRNLRKWMQNKGREEADRIGINDIFGSMAYSGGMGNYLSNNFTSSTERIAVEEITRENMQRGIAWIVEMFGGRRDCDGEAVNY